MALAAFPQTPWTGRRVRRSFHSSSWMPHPSSGQDPQRVSLPGCTSRLWESFGSHRILVDPSTSIAFPTRLTPTSLRSTDEVLSLVGLGVRTVSFLKVKVCDPANPLARSAVNANDTSRLECARFHRSIALASMCLKAIGGPLRAWVYVCSPYPQTCKDLTISTCFQSEETMQTFLSSKTPCAIRIIPTRNTGFDHLRDGFVRAIQGRMKVLAKRGDVGDAELDRVDASLVTFKSLFATRTANKGEELLLVKLPSGGVAVEFEGEVLGKVEDPLVARELFMAYFLEKGANSEKVGSSRVVRIETLD